MEGKDFRRDGRRPWVNVIAKENNGREGGGRRSNGNNRGAKEESEHERQVKMVKGKWSVEEGKCWRKGCRGECLGMRQGAGRSSRSCEGSVVWSSGYHSGAEDSGEDREVRRSLGGYCCGAEDNGEDRGVRRSLGGHCCGVEGGGEDRGARSSGEGNGGV